jgi:hypothetical protein
MYCPSCGAESALDLNYCSRCGANMVQTLTTTQPVTPFSITMPALIIGAITVLLTLGGFTVLAVAARGLSRALQQPDPLIALMVFGMSTIMICDILLLRLLSRIVKASLETKQVIQLPKPAAREHPRQLSPRLEPVPSVTEHTTRTFSPAFRETADHSK